MPNVAATPPKPTMADADMKVAPYDRAMMTGLTFRPPQQIVAGIFRLFVSNVPQPGQYEHIDDNYDT